MWKKTNPFLGRFQSVIRHDPSWIKPVYDPERMISTIEGKPAIQCPEYDELNNTIITRIRRETTDDQ